MKVGDKVIILRGLWKGEVSTIRHISKNKRWVYLDYYNKSRYWRGNVELLEKVDE